MSLLLWEHLFHNSVGHIKWSIIYICIGNVLFIIYFSDVFCANYCSNVFIIHGKRHFFSLWNKVLNTKKISPVISAFLLNSQWNHPVVLGTLSHCFIWHFLLILPGEQQLQLLYWSWTPGQTLHKLWLPGRPLFGITIPKFAWYFHTVVPTSYI